MTRIQTGLSGTPMGGGTKPDPLAGRQQFQRTTSGIDWEKDERYRTPHPGPKQHIGRQQQPQLDIPQLREKLIRVRSKAPSIYYTIDGVPIPQDEWQTVPISAGLLAAVENGDLERGPDPEDEPQHRPPRERPERPRAPIRSNPPTPAAE